jgi:hypothetical protein
MIYMIDRNGKVIGMADGPVNENDLAERGERALASDLNLPPQLVTVTGFPTNPIITPLPEPELQGTLQILTDAGDADGDGLPDLPADGQSQATLTVRPLKPDGRAAKEPVEVQFRTSAGTLNRRKVTTENGQARVRITSNRDTVRVTVRATAEGYQPGVLRMEFLPLEG